MMVAPFSHSTSSLHAQMVAALSQVAPEYFGILIALAHELAVRGPSEKKPQHKLRLVSG